MKWPAQALKQKQPTDDPTGTGLAVNSQPMKWPAQALQQQPADDPTGTGLAANTASR